MYLEDRGRKLFPVLKNPTLINCISSVKGSLSSDQYLFFIEVMHAATMATRESMDDWPDVRKEFDEYLKKEGKYPS